jgi:hypothetical protein
MEFWNHLIKQLLTSEIVILAPVNITFPGLINQEVNLIIRSTSSEVNNCIMSHVNNSVSALHFDAMSHVNNI